MTNIPKYFLVLEVGSFSLFVCCWLLVGWGLAVGVDMVGMGCQVDLDDA